MRAKIQVMKVAPDYKRILMDTMREVVYGGIVAFANAAADEVPIITGLTRGIWLGVANNYAPLSRYAPPITIDVSEARAWFMPHWPVAKPNKNAIVFGSDQGVENGIALADQAVRVRESGSSFQVSFNLPEINYQYMESEWRSIQAGRSAMQTFIRETIQSEDLLRRALRNKLIRREYRNV
jgi:hypothetical protein